LLKERNMLLTLRHDAKRAGFVMPGPERLKKVPPYEYLASFPGHSPPKSVNT